MRFCQCLWAASLQKSTQFLDIFPKNCLCALRRNIDKENFGVLPTHDIKYNLSQSLSDMFKFALWQDKTKTYSEMTVSVRQVLLKSCLDVHKLFCLRQKIATISKLDLSCPVLPASQIRLIGYKIKTKRFRLKHENRFVSIYKLK